MKKAPKFNCTMSDVAKVAGVSAATVSMALRSDVRITAETQARVRRAAKKLGYKPDPVLSALVARKHHFAGHRATANLAVIVDDGWFKIAGMFWIDALIEGMRTACQRFGYSLEVLHLHRDLQETRHPDKLLHNRGIRGLIILSTVNRQFDLQLDWDQYAVIALGAQPGAHLFHRVGTDGFASMSLVCQKLAELGYQRVGLVNDMSSEARSRYEWIGSLAKERYIRPPRIKMVPPYLPDVFSKEAFLAWIKQHEPECVISNNPHLYFILKEAGYDLPGQIGLAVLTHMFLKEPLSYISHDFAFSGETSIELLHNLLMRGETGHPTTLRETLIYPKWIEGKTTRPIPKK